MFRQDDNTIKVMIVDDSAVVRQVLQKALSQERSIQIIGVASDPLFAIEKMKKEWPDVLILDVEMPRMDGITFLTQLMREHPVPVIICSTLTEKGASTTMQALSAGAVSVVTKPTIGVRDFLLDHSGDLISAVKSAARAKVKNLKQEYHRKELHPVPERNQEAMSRTSHRIVAIGTSTGGTQALEAVLTQLPRVCPPIVIVQHMPAMFTAAFAERLNEICQIEVQEAKSGVRLLPGMALIAPGGKHLKIVRQGAQYYSEVVDGPLVNRHKPSVDVLFGSVAKVVGKNSIGIIMTGMGADGARGLKQMKESGAITMAQDEESCVVFGMPKEAIKLDAAVKIGGFRDIIEFIQSA